MKTVYMDNAATTRVHQEVVAEMLPYFRDIYGNAHSVHSWGKKVNDAIDEARGKVSELIGGQPDEIVFTANATEASNLAIKGIAQAHQGKGKHIIISAIEHSPVLRSAETLEKIGFEVSVISVDNFGMINLDELAKSIREDTILVSIMQANGEVGSIQEIREISRIVKRRGIVFHTDAESSAGIIPVDVDDMGVDALSMAANSFHGPKGAGALWIRKGVQIMPLIEGGVAEGGRRAGTEDVPSIVGMGKAAELAGAEMSSRIEHISRLRDRLIKGVRQSIDHVMLTGHPTKRLPRTASFCVDFVEGEALLAFLDSAGVAAGSGSACASNVYKNASHVLSAMNIPPETARGALLFTVGPDNTDRDIDYVLEVLPPIVEKLRRISTSVNTKSP